MKKVKVWVCEEQHAEDYSGSIIRLTKAGLAEEMHRQCVENDLKPEDTFRDPYCVEVDVSDSASHDDIGQIMMEDLMENGEFLKPVEVVPVAEAMTWRLACEACDGVGIVICSTDEPRPCLEIQRCNQCLKYPGDHEAACVALRDRALLRRLFELHGHFANNYPFRIYERELLFTEEAMTWRPK